jgi:hypothetical protein
VNVDRFPAFVGFRTLLAQQGVLGGLDPAAEISHRTRVGGDDLQNVTLGE